MYDLFLNLQIKQRISPTSHKYYITLWISQLSIKESIKD